MAERKTKRTSTSRNGGVPCFEAVLFNVAVKLRCNMESSAYRPFSLGLIFLEHISDSFDAKRAELLEEYRMTSTQPRMAFECRRMRADRNLKETAKQPGIDESMPRPGAGRACRRITIFPSRYPATSACATPGA